MKKQKFYYSTRFPAKVIEKAHDLFLSKLDKGKNDTMTPGSMRISIGDESWDFNTLEEFLAEYPKADDFFFYHDTQSKNFTMSQYGVNASVSVQFPARSDIESIFQVFERNIDSSKIVITSDPVKIFIGHGHDQQWRLLKDHLHDFHGFDVITYEIGPRAGLSVKEVLEKMAGKSSLALLILTGEDQHADGELHARENVIHELGIFQGRLGFKRAIILLEEEVKQFSNILGINHIPFSKGNIKETFGDVLAIIKREFE